MACAVGFTHLHQVSSQAEPGVTIRWWDGTMQRQFHQYPNGNPAQLTEYAEDGKTVLVEKEWEPNGELIHSKIRLEDGRIEEKEWYRGGQSLQQHTIWMPNAIEFQMMRQYAQNGNLTSEVYKTEDGSSVVKKKAYNPDSGLIETAYEVLSNADQREIKYSQGKKTMEHILRGTGDTIDSIFDGEEKLLNRITLFKLDNSRFDEYFGKSGKLIYSKEVLAQKRESIVSVFKEGTLLFKQHFKSGDLSEVTEYTGGKTIARVIKFAGDGSAEVRSLRLDNTLETVKEYNSKGEVTRTLNYATNGTTLESEQAGGTPDTFDDRLFTNVNVQTLIEEDAK